MVVHSLKKCLLNVIINLQNNKSIRKVFNKQIRCKKSAFYM